MKLKFPKRNPNIVCLPATPDNMPAYLEYMSYLATLPENKKRTYGTKTVGKSGEPAFPGRNSGVPGCYSSAFNPSRSM